MWRWERHDDAPIWHRCDWTSVDWSLGRQISRWPADLIFRTDSRRMLAHTLNERTAKPTGAMHKRMQRSKLVGSSCRSTYLSDIWNNIRSMKVHRQWWQRWQVHWNSVVRSLHYRLVPIVVVRPKTGWLREKRRATWVTNKLHRFQRWHSWTTVLTFPRVLIWRCNPVGCTRTNKRKWNERVE